MVYKGIRKVKQAYCVVQGTTACVKGIVELVVFSKCLQAMFDRNRWPLQTQKCQLKVDHFIHAKNFTKMDMQSLVGIWIRQFV